MEQVIPNNITYVAQNVHGRCTTWQHVALGWGWTTDNGRGNRRFVGTFGRCLGDDGL
jgi:hypothetical protein